MLCDMRAVVAAQPGVIDVPDLFAVVVGPSSLIVNGDVTFHDDLDVPAVEGAIMRSAVSTWEALALDRLRVPHAGLPCSAPTRRGVVCTRDLSGAT